LTKDLPCFYSDGYNYRWDAKCTSLWIIAIGYIHRLAQAILGDYPSLLYSLSDVKVVNDCNNSYERSRFVGFKVNGVRPGNKIW